MKFSADRPFTDAEKAARKLLEIAKRDRPPRTDESTSRKSTGRFCSRMEAAQQNTLQVWRLRSPAAGYGATNAGPM
jgi:hypothetical protein